MIGYYILRIDKYSGYFADSIFTLTVPPEHKLSMYIELLPMSIGILGILLGVLLYKTSLASRIKSVLGNLPQIINKGYYFDEIYNIIFVGGASKLGQMSNFIDKKIIDRVGPTSASNLVNTMSSTARSIQTGYIPNYIFLTMLGIIMIMTYFIINSIKLT